MDWEQLCEMCGFQHLPINAQHSDNPHCGELVADIHHNDRFAHEVSENPLPVSDQLVNVEGHHKQEEHICYCQVKHVDVWYHFLLARCHRVDNQPVGNNSNWAQDAINGREYVHESGDVDLTVRRGSWILTWLVSEAVCLVVFAQYASVIHLQLVLTVTLTWSVIKWRTVRSGIPSSPSFKLRAANFGSLSKSAYPLLCPGFHLQGLYDLAQEEGKKQCPIQADSTSKDIVPKMFICGSKLGSKCLLCASAASFNGHQCSLLVEDHAPRCVMRGANHKSAL